MLTEEFINTHINNSKKKRDLLLDCKNKHCNLIGIVGRVAFHIFDETYMTWICSSEALGYEHLLPDVHESDWDYDDEY